MQGTSATIEVDELSREENDVMAVALLDGMVDAATAAETLGLPRGLCALALDLLVSRGLLERAPGSEDAHAAVGFYRLAP